MIWDGHKLVRIKAEEQYGCAYLAVSHAESRGSGVLNWGKSIAFRGAKNADLLKALSQYCFTCPLPLTADRRRLDSLHLCPEGGYSLTSFPANLSFLDGDLPPFTIPLGTFKDLRKTYQKDSVFSDMIVGLSEEAFKMIEAREKTSVALLVTAHVDRHRRSSSDGPLGTYSAPSKMYWIQDGVVTHYDILTLVGSCCSVSGFVSAEGLKTDMTGLHLLDDADKNSRESLAAKLIHTALSESISLPLDKMISGGVMKSRVMGGLFMLIALPAAIVNPPIGLPMIGVGGVALAKGGAMAKNLATIIQDGLEKTIQQVGKKYS